MKHTYKMFVRKSDRKQPLRTPKYGRKDNTKMDLILFWIHSIMLQITETSKGFLRNGSWSNMRYCYYFTIVTFYKGVTEVLSSHPPEQTEES
jgi:hypothetical protein